MRFAIIVVAAVLALGTVFGDMYKEMLVHGWQRDKSAQAPVHRPMNQPTPSKYPVTYVAPQAPIIRGDGTVVPTQNSFIAPRAKNRKGRSRRASNPFIGN